MINERREREIHRVKYSRKIPFVCLGRSVRLQCLCSENNYINKWDNNRLDIFPKNITVSVYLFFTRIMYIRFEDLTLERYYKFE